MTEIQKINFNARHLTKGDPLPEFNSKLRLYSTRCCPFAQRVALALIAKRLDFEVIMIDLDNKPEGFRDKSHYGKVPVLEILDGITINESLVIVEYLDDAYPDTPLLPSDPKRKATDKAIAQSMSIIHNLLHKLMTNQPLDDDLVISYYKVLDNIQHQLSKRNSPFLHGNGPGFVDYMIWPWFERLPAFEEAKIQLYEHNFSILLDYLDKMAKDPVVMECRIPIEDYKAFLEARLLGQIPSYNY